MLQVHLQVDGAHILRLPSMTHSLRSQMVSHGRVLHHDEAAAAAASSMSKAQLRTHRAVTTAEQLLSAVVAGSPHIELRQHMDLTRLPLLHTSGGAHAVPRSVLGPMPPTVQIIRVRLSAVWAIQLYNVGLALKISL